ncbi:MAG: gene transfer agent family protein [Pseudomonadota bacterium]
MVNRYRGEVALTFGSETHTLCLTLDALARLEDALGCSDLPSLMAKLAGGNLPALQIKAVLTEALVAGGTSRTEANDLIANLGRPAELTRAYADLIRATFAS